MATDGEPEQKTLLIVDDEQDLVLLVSMILEEDSAPSASGSERC